MVSSFLDVAGCAALWIAAIALYGGLQTGLALLFVTPDRPQH